jgi:hypothetical protein
MSSCCFTLLVFCVLMPLHSWRCQECQLLPVLLLLLLLQGGEHAVCADSPHLLLLLAQWMLQLQMAATQSKQPHSQQGGCFLVNGAQQSYLPSILLASISTQGRRALQVLVTQV